MMAFNCPKNFKKGRLIANRFRWTDLAIAIIGIALSIIAVMTYITGHHGSSPYIIGTLLLPGIICFVLVSPAGIYHNVLEFIIVIFHYLFSIRIYLYGGIAKHETAEEIAIEKDDEE